MRKCGIPLDANGLHTSFGIDGKVYVYWFENHGFNDYNIFMRAIDNH